MDGSGIITKEFCEDSCWAAKAEEEKDITICEAISGTFLYGSCLEEAGGVDETEA